MATEFDILVLLPTLNAMTGFQASLTDAKLVALLRAGMVKYNGDVPNGRVLAGTILDDTPTLDEQMYLCLCALHTFLLGRMIESSEQGISVSNVAGKTDLSGIELAFAKRRTEVEKLMDKLLVGIRTLAVASDVRQRELGETLDIARVQVLYPVIGYW